MTQNKLRSVKWENPLTNEEKVVVSRLLGHDTTTVLCYIDNQVRVLEDGENFEMKKNLIREWVYHISHIQNTVDTLTQSQSIYLSKNCGNDFIPSEKSLRYSFQLLNSAAYTHGLGKLELEVNGFDSLLAAEEIVYSMLYNLVKNGLVAQASNNGNVLIKVDPKQSLPDNVSFVPEGSLNYKEFVPFHVQNGGREFPKIKSPKEYLTDVPEKRGKGFGLYFVGLAAKALRTPIDIKSESDKTTISIYHPIY